MPSIEPSAGPSTQPTQSTSQSGGQNAILQALAKLLEHAGNKTGGTSTGQTAPPAQGDRITRTSQ